MPDEKPQGSFFIVGTFATLLIVAGSTVFLLVGSRQGATQGSRVSTRLQWESREAEIDKAIAQARAEGKLPELESGCDLPRE